MPDATMRKHMCGDLVGLEFLLLGKQPRTYQDLVQLFGHKRIQLNIIRNIQRGLCNKHQYIDDDQVLYDRGERIRPVVSEFAHAYFNFSCTTFSI